MGIYIFFVIRQFFYGIVSTPIQVIFVQLLQGDSYGLFLTGTVYYIDELAPNGLKVIAQTLASSVFFGVSGIIGSYGGGWLIDKFGLISIYHTGIIVSLSVSLLFYYHSQWQNI